MVTFSHRDAGTPAAAWSEAGVKELPALSAGCFPGAGTMLLVVAAHPDDESLGAGGLMASALAAGARVRVVLCTAGEASHPESPSHGAERLAGLRLEEFAAAMSALDPGARRAGAGHESGGAGLDWVFLGLPDGRLADHPDPLRRAIEAELATRGAAREAVIAAPYREDGHGDHEAAGRAAAAVAVDARVPLLEFPLWYWHWARPDDPRWRAWRRLPLPRGALTPKQSALAAHRSQTAPLSSAPGDEALLSASFLAHFTDAAEIFRTSLPGPQEEGSALRGADTAAADFEALHRREPDPWGFGTSWYEQRKRAVTLAALPHRRYAVALEAGCSIGVLTEELAGRCDRLMAVDASTTALDAARRRLPGAAHVSWLHAVLPQDWPAGPDSLDLAIVSEIGYFLSGAELDALLDALTGSMRPGGHLLLCHWLGPIAGWELDGAQVHERARRRLGWRNPVRHHEPEFLLDVLEAPRG